MPPPEDSRVYCPYRGGGYPKRAEMFSKLSAYFDVTTCPDCEGERLCKLSRSITVNGTRLPELSVFSLEKLYQWVSELADSLSEQQSEFVNAYLLDIKTKLVRFINVGLGYLSLDRQTITLSGGELQRLRLAAALDSELSGIIYILTSRPQDCIPGIPQD